MRGEGGLEEKGDRGELISSECTRVKAGGNVCLVLNNSAEGSGGGGTPSLWGSSRPRRQRGKTLQLQQDLKTGVGQRLSGWARPCPCLLASSAALQPVNQFTGA